MDTQVTLFADEISSILFDLNAVNQTLMLISETHPIYDDLLGLLIQRLDDCIDRLEPLSVVSDAGKQREK